MASAAECVVAEARTLGLVLAGAAPLAPIGRAGFLERWLAEGRAGEMRYLARRTAERNDPALLVPWARSVVAFAYPYRPPPPPPLDWRASLRGRIAAYALGTDYHDRMDALLRALVDRLRSFFPAARFRHYVDTGPVLEREWAMRAGLGWIGKNTLLLDRDRGSYFFLAVLFTDVELEPAAWPSPDHCGACTRCHVACPTGALGPGYTMDPRRCLAYLTIEHRSAIPV
ncbi:MAG TPA: tRNA epoxyqueuosine(34) reductase QueG, partial [Candidatus Binatia bacterium]|nr:tRNA epoxyqueuosine(34) reductase QueG [Candidatus Binatia bacterium]